MMSIRHLVNPSPNDANLRVQSDNLGMLREGETDLDRYFFYAGKGIPKDGISNRTIDPFNHTRSTGGYNNDGTTIFENHVITSDSAGGIVPLSTPQSSQNTGNQVSNHPVPVINALVDSPIHYNINKLVDTPVPPTINPIVAPAPSPDPDNGLLRMSNSNEYKKYADGHLHEIEARTVKR